MHACSEADHLEEQATSGVAGLGGGGSGGDGAAALDGGVDGGAAAGAQDPSLVRGRAPPRRPALLLLKIWCFAGQKQNPMLARQGPHEKGLRSSGRTPPPLVRAVALQNR
jgi:hypothetical protein